MKQTTIKFIKSRVFKLTAEGLSEVNGLVVKGTIIFKDKVSFIVEKYLKDNSNKLNIKNSAKFNVLKNINPNHKVDIKNDIHFNSSKKIPTVEHKIVYIGNVAETKKSRLTLPKQVFNIVHALDIWNVIYASNLANKIRLITTVNTSEKQRIICSSNKIQFRSSMALTLSKKLISNVHKINIVSRATLGKLSKIRVNGFMNILTYPLQISIFELSTVGDYDNLSMSEMDDIGLGDLDGIERT